MYYCTELRRAWGSLWGSLHCTNPRIDQTECHLEQCRIFSSSHLNLRCPQVNQPTLQLVNRRVWQGSDPGTHSPKRFAKFADLACSTNWRNYVDMPDKHPLSIPISLKILHSFSSESPKQSTYSSTKKMHSFHEQSPSYPASCSAQKIWWDFQ